MAQSRRSNIVRDRVLSGATAVAGAAIGGVALLRWILGSRILARHRTAPLDARRLLGKSLEIKIAVAFGAAVVAICVVGIGSYQSISQFIVDSRWVNHTHQVLESISALNADLDAANGAARGYVITGEESFV